MKSLILSIAVLLGGAALALFIKQDPGYVLMGYKQWTVEMSLVLFVLLVAALVVTMYYSLRVVSGTVRSPRRYKKWRQQRHQRIAHERLNKGLLHTAGGDWKKAEKSLLTYVKDSENPRPAYLAAAKVAQAQGANERRDHYLRLAHENANGEDLAIELTRAELMMDNGQLEQALALLVRLRNMYPKNVHVLEMLASIYVRLQDWKNLAAMMPQLSKYRVFSPTKYAAMEIKAYQGFLQEAAQSSSEVELHNTWNKMPKHLRNHEELLSKYISLLVQRGEHAMAEPLLRTALKRNWNEHFVYMYGLLETGDHKRQLDWMESFLKSYENNPVLLLTLGRMAMRAQLWGKARSYLERSAERGGLPESFFSLANLLEKVEEPDAASKCYRDGLAAASRLTEKVRLKNEFAWA